MVKRFYTDTAVIDKTSDSGLATFNCNHRRDIAEVDCMQRLAVEGKLTL